MQRELVERAQAGDHEAFAELVRASFPRLHGAARLILRDPDGAQDAVQEALVLAWRHVRALREPSAWDAWLHRLTVRACYRAARKVRRRDLIEVPAVFDHDLRAGGDLSMAIAQNDQLGRALGGLPIDQRAVMVLHFYVDLPITEVADILDIPIGTAKSRLHRGLEAMRASMPAEPSEPARLARERLA